MGIRALRTGNGTSNGSTGTAVPLARRPRNGVQVSERRHALARAIAMDVDADALRTRLDGAQPQVQALLSRLASCPGVRHASLWTASGHKLASVARREDDPLDLGVLMSALSAVAELAHQSFEAGHAETITTTAADLRIEMRVLEKRFLLILAIESRVPAERVQPVVNTTLLSLHASLKTR